MATAHEKTGAREARRERAAKSLELRINGYSYRQIARALSISERTAYLDVQEELAALDALVSKRAERLRDLELARLDKILRSLWDPIKAGDAKAAMAAIKALERRARLLGLDAPTKVAPTDPEGAKPYQPELVDPRSLSVDTLRAIVQDLRQQGSPRE